LIQSKLYGSATLVSGVIDTADHKKIDVIVEYLLEYKVICKKACLMKKTGGRKSRDRVPLREQVYILISGFAVLGSNFPRKNLSLENGVCFLSSTAPIKQVVDSLSC
jgi:hypothetical protein